MLQYHYCDFSFSERLKLFTCFGSNSNYTARKGKERKINNKNTLSNSCNCRKID